MTPSLLQERSRKFFHKYRGFEFTSSLPEQIKSIASGWIEKKIGGKLLTHSQIVSLLPETGLHSGASQSQLHWLYKATVLFIIAVWCGLFTDLEYEAHVSQGPHLGNENIDWYYYSFLAKSVWPSSRASAYFLFWSDSLQDLLWVLGLES